ncbi:MAG: flagellar hook-length control protein FliK, partial [Woeseiaceae bacterium]
QNPLTEAGVLTAASMGLRDRGQHSEPGTRAAPITVANTILDGEDRSPLTDFARRFGLTPLQRAEPGTDAVQPRIAVAQATQALQSQINPQPSQPTLSLASAATADTSYSALAQQSTDLIGTSVRDSAWGEKVGDRVVMMAANQLKQAEIRLTPAELGPLRVRVSVEDGNTHVTFHAQHAVTREALEQALPRLREMLAENGLSLGQADVSDRGVNDSGREQDSDGSAANLGADDANDVALDLSAESSRRVSSSNGLVDTFA